MALAQTSTPSLSNEEILSLEDQITELAAHIHAASYRLLMLIGEFDAAEGWAGPGLRSCAHWLSWKCGIGLNAAREKVRVAHALPELPKISKSFSAGEISYSKVRAMTRVATPANEEFLLRIALHGTATHVERAVSQFKRSRRDEALAAENERHECRKVVWSRDEDGSWRLYARFAPEQGERIMKAVEAALDEIEAEQENVTAVTSCEPNLDQPMPDRFEQRRADALETLADSFLAGEGGGANGGDRCTLHVHTDLDTLNKDGNGTESSLAEGGNLSAETSRRLGCDCAIIPWKESADGETLNVGRKTRSIPPSIRRALQKRDQGCRFPGCTANKHVDAHHIQYWADGGETKLSNLVTLCRHHHRAIHEGGFQVRMNSNSQPEFRDPNGKVIPIAPEIRYSGNVFALINTNRRQGLAVTAETCIPHWDGEPMDSDMVIAKLVELERC